MIFPSLCPACGKRSTIDMSVLVLPSDLDDDGRLHVYCPPCAAELRKREAAEAPVQPPLAGLRKKARFER